MKPETPRETAQGEEKPAEAAEMTSLMVGQHVFSPRDPARDSAALRVSFAPTTPGLRASGIPETGRVVLPGEEEGSPRNSHLGISAPSPRRALRKKNYDSQIILGEPKPQEVVQAPKTPLYQDSKFASECVAEAIGVFILVLIGCGTLCSLITTGSQVGIWQVAVVWGIGATLAILVSASISGAHLNPAVSLALAMFRREQFDWRKLPGYWFSQFAGSIFAAAILYGTYNPLILLFEAQKGIVRGQPGSELTAMLFGEYFPNPAGPFANDPRAVSVTGAVFIEGFGTMILMFCILAITDDRSRVFVRKDMAPFFIGLIVSSLFSVLAPLTQAGLNPARDFGPRFVAYLAGWDATAIPGPRNGFWVYIVGPIIGAPLGCLFYDFSIGRALHKMEAPKREPSRSMLQTGMSRLRLSRAKTKETRA